MKKIVSISIVLILLLLTVSCTSKSSETTGSADPLFAGIKAKTWYSGDKDSLKQLKVEQELDVQSVYAAAQYTELMLYGEYKLDKDSDRKRFVKNTSPMELRFYNQAASDPKTLTADVTSLPYEIIAGAYNIKNRAYRTIYYPLCNKAEENWAILRFADKEEKLAEVLCTFEVSGKTVRYYPVEYYEAVQQENADGENEYVDCTYTLGTTPLEYSFDFMGPYLALTNGTDHVVLCSRTFCSDANVGPSFWAYALPDSPLIANLVSGSSYGGKLKNGNSVWHLSWKFDSNGLATLTWTDTIFGGEKETHYKQVVYWVTGVGGLFNNQFVFADEDNVYYYSDNHAQHEARQLQDYMEEDEINAISDEQLQEMERQKTSLFEALTKAFEEAGITVSIDMSLGEIALDNSVLFAGDSSEITSEGKAFLKKFVNVYSSVVFGEEYAGKIERIVIEGHTAPLSNSTYESGLPLSRERANNVKECCISDEMDLPDTVSGVFRDSLETRGMSNLRPVYDADGNINLDACRRVSFVFVINTDSL